MPEPAILAIDQGTSHTKAILLDRQGTIRSVAVCPVHRVTPRPGWVECDPEALWRTVEEAIADCLGRASGISIAGVAITNQRESVVAWDKRTGAPVGPVILWQCRRTHGFLDQLREEGHEEWIRERSGLLLDPTFSAAKARWLIQRRPQDVPLDEILIGTVDSWLLWHFTGGRVHATDGSNASRTQLFNIHRMEWDAELLERFEVPRSAVPEVRPSSSFFGETISLGALNAGVPILSVIGDSHGSLFGQRGFEPGVIKVTYGTGSSLMSPLAEPVLGDRSVALTVAWTIGARATYAAETNILVSASVVDWLADTLRLSGGIAQVWAMAAHGQRERGVMLVPALFGLGAPYRRNDARGIITGLSGSTTLEDIARAAVDAIAHQVTDALELMERACRQSFMVILADGGASASEDLMQFQADVARTPVLRSETAYVSALGAGYLAGLELGWWRSLNEIKNLPFPQRQFPPTMPESTRVAWRQAWRQAVVQCLQPF